MSTRILTGPQLLYSLAGQVVLTNSTTSPQNGLSGADGVLTGLLQGSLVLPQAYFVPGARIDFGALLRITLAALTQFDIELYAKQASSGEHYLLSYTYISTSNPGTVLFNTTLKIVGIGGNFVTVCDYGVPINSNTSTNNHLDYNGPGDGAGWAADEDIELYLKVTYNTTGSNSPLTIMNPTFTYTPPTFLPR